jgi:hypothetical protein
MRLLTGLFLIGLLACDNPKDKLGQESNSLSGRELADKKLLDEIIKSTDLKGALDRFQFPFGDSLRTNSNQFIFLAENTWDTSFVLMLERRADIIKAVYYETTPNYHLNTPYMDDEIELTYFDGFSFKIDTTKWNLIVAESNKLLQMKDSLKVVGQLDGSFYLLSHNSTIKLCCDPYNPNLQDKFKSLQLLIRANLMRDVYRRKLDIGQQADRDIKKEKERERTGAQQ